MATIAFYNHKGGVGKTTDVLLLAYSLVNKGKKVLLMDLDVQHNLTLALLDFDFIVQNEQRIQTTFDLARDPYVDPRPISVEVLDVNGNKRTIDVIPSLEKDIPRLIKGEIPISNPFALKPVVDKLKDKYDYILVDMPPVFLASTQWGLFISDYVIIPINITDYSQYSSYTLVRDILPLILPYKDVKVLGFLISNAAIRNVEQRLKVISDDLQDYMKGVLSRYPQLVKCFYKDIVFPFIIPQDAELRELIRFNAKYPPIFETIRKSSYKPTQKLRDVVVNKFADEVERRINSLRGQ